MLVPIVIFAACFGGGAVAAANWLPDLGPGSVADIAFFSVCGLLGGALSLAGLHVYSLVTELKQHLGVTHGELFAAIVRDIVLDSGTLFGLAGIIYMLAPRIGGHPGPMESASLAQAPDA